MALYDTALSVVSDAAVELGLGAVSDAYGSTDPNIIQLRTLLKSLGRRLALEREWRHLVKEYTFVTTSSATYNLPADFSSMVANSSWNRSANARAVPLGSQVWQYLKATDITTSWLVYFRPGDTTLTLHPDPPTAGETIAFEYRSRYWVRASGSSANDKDAPTANTDSIMFDATLMVPALKLEFKAAKGLPVDAHEQRAYDVAWAAATAADTSAAPVLSLDGQPIDERFLTDRNAPDTGYGFDGFGGLF